MKRYPLDNDPPSARATIDYDAILNEQQQQVVTARDGPMLVLAGAGSGKTHTLTCRVAYLVDHGVPPDRILLLTFTNKAARSMTNRIDDLLELDMSALWSGTFHNIANRILRSEAPKLGYRQDYGILDSEDSATLFKTCLSEADVGHLDRRFPKGRVLGRIYSLCVNTQQTIEQVIGADFQQFSEVIEPIRRVLGLYQARKLEMSVMDFDDLLLNWKHLLEDDDQVRRQYAQTFEHVLVDEYQDTNHLQGEIIDLMASEHRNLMVVGDDCQSIYGFRGADFQNILGFPDRYQNCRQYKLETNYRSTPQILELANASIHHNRDQFQKTLRPARPDGAAPALVRLRDVDQQAEFVCQRILEFVDEGLGLDQIAVLYRSHRHSMELQVEMTRRNIPYVVRSGLRFFEQTHIKDVLSYLEFLFNPRDELSFLRLARQWPRIGAKRAANIWLYAQSQADPLDAITHDKLVDSLPRRAEASWRRAGGLLTQLRQRRMSATPGKLVELILDHAYTNYANRTYDKADNRLADLDQLAAYANHYQDIDHFLGEISLLSGLSGQEILVGGDTPDDAVTLSSIHQAKGLEWSAVFGLWLSDGQFPSARADTDREFEEERRLFYVMVTRARDELLLCHPITHHRRDGRRTVLKESPFVEELRYDDHLDDEPFEEWWVER